MKKLLGIALGATLVLGATFSAAQAGSNEKKLGAALLGLGAGIVIGNQLNKNRVVVVPQPVRRCHNEWRPLYNQYGHFVRNELVEVCQ